MNRCECGHERMGYEIVGEVLRKSAKGSKHMLRKPPAWGVQKEIIDHHRDQLKSIEITDTETNQVYTVEFANFCYKSFEQDRGFGTQYFLVLRHWTLGKVAVVKIKKDSPLPEQVKFPERPAWAWHWRGKENNEG